MTIRLENQWRTKLARLPETGMGFQLVDIRLRSGRWLESLFVHNGQECETNEQFDPREVVEVRLHRDEQDSQPMAAAV